MLNKVHQMREVMIKAKRLPKQISSTVPVQVLTKDELNDLGVQNMADAVKRFAGVTVRDYGGIGGLKTVSVRNLGAAHTAISYDGVVMSNTQAGQIDVGRLSLDNVSTLSLAIGQNEDMLQSARSYASAGILNIVTQKNSLDDKHSSAFTGQMKGGSFGFLSPNIRWEQKLNNYTSYSVDGNYMRADGIYPFKLHNGKYVTDERRYNSDIDAWHGEANLYHKKGNGEFDAKIYYYQSQRGLPGSVILYNTKAMERLWDKDMFTQLNYKLNLSSKFDLQTRAKFAYSWNRYKDTDAQYENGHTIEKFHQNEYYLSATLLYKMSKQWSMALAEDGSINTLWTNLQDCPFPTRYSSLTAYDIRYQNELINANFSMIGTYINDKVQTGAKPANKKKLSPSLSLNIKPFTDEMLYLRLMYKNTFRVPTFNDLYYYRMGNRNILPEKATEYNVGVTWNEQYVTLLKYLSITIDGYYNTVSDKIVAFPSTYVWRMANFGKVHITGLDMTLATEVPITRKIGVRIQGAYTFQKAIDVTDKSDANYGNQLPYTPKQNGNMSLVITNPWVTVGYSILAVSKRYSLDQNTADYAISGYAEHTLSLSHDFKLKHCLLHLQGEVINLTDKQYEVIKYYPMPGRSWALSGTIHL